MATIIRNGEIITLTPEEEAGFEASRAPTLPQAKRERREDIRRRRDMAELHFSYGGKTYSAAAAGRIAVLANAARASGTGFPVRFVATDDTETSLTRAEMQAFETALATHLQACSANSVTLRQAVNAAGDVAAVRAIDIEAGWP